MKAQVESTILAVFDKDEMYSPNLSNSNQLSLNSNHEFSKFLFNKSFNNT